MTLNAEQIARMIQAGMILVEGVGATVEQIKAMFKMLHHELTEEQLNEIATAIKDDAARRELLARLDREQAIHDGAQSADTSSFSGPRGGPLPPVETIPTGDQTPPWPSPREDPPAPVEQDEPGTGKP